MIVYCTEEFKHEYEKLIKKKSYRYDLPQAMIQSIFKATAEELNKHGRKLNLGETEVDFLKLRIQGRGGYRCYYLMIKDGHNVYLGFIHPKTGSKGVSNITGQAEQRIRADIQTAAKDKKLYQLTATEDGQLAFQHLSEIGED